MPRDHFSTAHPQQAQQLAHALAACHNCTGDAPSADAIVNRIFAAGYDLHESEVPQPRTQQLASLDGSAASMFKVEFSMQLTSERQAMKNFQARRQWATTTSKSDDVAKAAQQRQVADIERARITTERFVNGLVGAVRVLIADQWHRASVKWQQDHDHQVDNTSEPAQPSFSDTVDAVVARLGYVRADAQTPQVNRTRKAS